ncbi:MAG: Gfo/Idh/MocA family oxidoreductase [Chloroflexi bacterium]|nr:Gfo/Idh/MocA family oxidoreductase [Chloroflexota bacterium]MCC6891745.1 Gfo/Idh/MocA family oxidoreductase [Anaerolineae bacterium]
MLEDTYGHTPVHKAFQQLDVYGIGYDERRANRIPIRLGIIGAGGVAQSKYFPAVARLRMIWEPVEIAAFSEPREEHGRKVQAIYGGQWYADYRTMLAEAKLDGVIILSPDNLHFEHTLASLESGRHVLVEKPITGSLVDAKHICNAADEHHAILMTVANKRYSPPYRRAKQAIESGSIHDPALFVGKFNLGYDYVDLLESGTIHLFDIARYLMGDVVALTAIGVNKYGRNRRKYPIDNAVITLEFASGAVGTIYTSASALNLKPWERVEVYGDHAWLSVEDQHELLIYDSEEGPTKSWRTVIPNTLLFDEEFGGYMGIIENFAQAIRGNDQPLVTGWDGYRAIELLRAVQLSLMSNSRVTLPLSDPHSADHEVKAWLEASGWPGKS